MKKRKTQKPKPVKVWAVVDAKGLIRDGFAIATYFERADAESYTHAPSGQSVRRATITVED